MGGYSCRWRRFTQYQNRPYFPIPFFIPDYFRTFGRQAYEWMATKPAGMHPRGRRPGVTTIMIEPLAGVFPDLPELFTAAEWSAISAELELSQRHQQVARLLCLGWSPSRISESLRLDVETVLRHIHSLYRHLKVQSAVGVPVRLVLALRALEQTA